MLVSPAPGEGESIEHAATRFLELTADLLLIVGFEGAVRWVNDACEKLLGYRADELIGHPGLDFVHPGDRDRVVGEAARFAETGDAAAALEVRVLMRSGDHRRLLFSATPSAGDRLLHLVGKDVTHQRVLERELRLAREVASAIGGASSTDEAVEATLREVCEWAGWDLGQAWIRSADGRRLECSPAWYPGSDRFEAFRRLSEGFVFTPGFGLPGKVLQSGQPLLVDDVAAQPELARTQFATEAGLGAAVGVPVIARGEVVAVLEFFFAKAREQDEELAPLVTAVVQHLGTGFREHQAEGMLHRTERHFAALAHSAPDAIVSVDATGAVTFFNQAAEQAFGYPSSEIAGKPVSLILPALGEATDVQQLEGRTVELRGRRKGGAELPLEAAFSSWEANGERFMTGVLRDVSERRRAEETVHEAEERFRGAFDQAPIGIALVSIEADRAGCFLRVNRALCDFTGHSAQELIGVDFGKVVDPQATDGSDRRYVPWMLAGELANYEAETRLRHADGHTLDVLLHVSLVRDARERPLYLIAQVQDMTGRKEAERRLHETSQRMQAILDNTTAVVYLKDLEGRYLLVNRSFESLFDVTRDETVSRTDAELFPPELAQVLRANDLRVMREQIPFEVEEVIPVGERARTYLSIKFPLLDGSRRPYAVCGISTDITERKHAEEGLRASEQHFREIVNTTHEAFVSIDESGCITAWNPEAESTFGWTEDEALGRSLADTIIPARYRGAHSRGLEQFLRTGRAALLNRRVEIEALRRDGHEFPVELTITAIRVGGRYSFNAFLHDISERKQAEQALRRLADIIEASGDAVFATTTVGEITSWNAGAEQLYGYTAEEAIGSALRMLVSPNRAPRDFEALDRALNGVRLDDYQTDQLRKDGTIIPVSLSVSPIRASSGALVGASVIARDRTERKRAEEALREVQEAFRTAFEDAPIGMALFSVDPSADGLLLQVNTSLSEITGYSADELLRTSLHAISHPLDQRQELPLSEELLSGRIPNYQLEKRFVRRDGSAVWVMHNASIVHDASGRLLYGIAQVQDITERKRAEESLAKVAAELEQRAVELERSNADLQQFAYVASHDLSEPLRMVSSYVQLLERRYGDRLDSDAREFIDFAVDGVNRMQRLIEDLLAYSRVGTSEYELEPVDVDALVVDTLAGMRATVEDSAAIVEHESLPTVLGDESQLRQLFQNLISNGIKFVQEGPPRIHVSAERDGRDWRFCVADNGIGIDSHHAERIFAVFKRLHGRDAYPGSGIGLSICKRIVERHNGRIWVEPNEGGGSRFCFTIPVSEDE